LFLPGESSQKAPETGDFPDEAAKVKIFGVDEK
jgi:hypothetical protein